MKQGIGRSINLAIGIGIAGVLIWFFFKDADWSRVGAEIGQAHLGLLAAGMALHLFGIFLKSVRWKIMLSPVKQNVSVHNCFKYFNIGFAVNSIIPGRIGEVLRPWLMSKEEDIPFASTFATIVTERILDLVIILLFFGTIFIMPSALGPDPNAAGAEMLKTAGLVVLAIVICAIGFLVFLKVKTEWAIRLVRFFLKPLPEKIGVAIEKLLRTFVEGIGGLRGWRQIGGLVLTSFFGWLGGLTLFWFAFEAFGLSQPFTHFFFLQAAAALGVAIPTPAGSGGYHGAIILVGATLWQHPDPTIQAIALLTHIMIFGSMTIIGGFYLISGGINVFSAADRAESTTEDQIAPAGKE